MNASEKLLNQVKEDEPDLPLSGAPLIEAFDELLKYGLIAVEDDRMILKERGEEAILVGVQKVIDQLKTEEEMACFSEKARQKEFNLFRVFLICCFHSFAADPHVQHEGVMLMPNVRIPAHCSYLGEASGSEKHILQLC